MVKQHGINFVTFWSSLLSRGVQYPHQLPLFDPPLNLVQTERSLLEQGVIPETPDDFDRLLLSTPNSSVLWLQYMAYYLHLTEIDKARGVAERALKTISFRSVNFLVYVISSVCLSV